MAPLTRDDLERAATRVAQFVDGSQLRPGEAMVLAFYDATVLIHNRDGEIDWLFVNTQPLKIEERLFMGVVN